MTKHMNCRHEATSSARARCRREQATRQAGYRTELEKVLTSYWDNSNDLFEIVGRISHLASMTSNPDLLAAVVGYYDSSLSAEEVVNAARGAMII